MEVGTLFIATTNVMQHLNMLASFFCAICGSEDSWMQFLVLCTMAHRVWTLFDSELVEHMLSTTEPNARNLIFWMMESLSGTEFTKLAVTLWEIWSSWRKLIHEGEHQSPMSTHMFINKFLSDHELSNPVKIQVPPRTMQRAQVRAWIPPSSYTIKINVDGDVSRNDERGAIGAVCRDDMGLYLGSSALVLPGMIDPATLEALACREALDLAKDLMVQQMKIASYCKSVVTDISNGMLGPISTIINKINETKE